MDQLPHLKQAFWQTSRQVLATIRPVTRAAHAEYTLALRATSKAAMSRRSATEVRALYVPVTTAARLEFSQAQENTMNRQSNRPRLAAMLATALTLTFLLAYGFSGAIDAVTVQQDQTLHQSGVLDPSMDGLEGVTHHG